jgi:hypothetical protein
MNMEASRSHAVELDQDGEAGLIPLDITVDDIRASELRFNISPLLVCRERQLRESRTREQRALQSIELLKARLIETDDLRISEGEMYRKRIAELEVVSAPEVPLALGDGTPLDVYESMIAAGFSHAEAREEGWPSHPEL